MQQAKIRYFLVPLFLILACATVFAQANSELTGLVTDQTGAVIADAKVVLTDPGTGEVHSTISGPTGLYDIPGLNPFTYNLKVTARGFQAYEKKGIVINVSSTVRSDIKLTVGAESQTVTVEADALVVQTDSNVISTLVSSEQISEIATENRNFASLAALGLGVSSLLPDNNTPMAGAGGSSFSISANGLRQSHNIWLIDGGESDDRGGAGGLQVMPPQDAIAEFQMLTSNYPPDYGISSGATFSLSLKSGTQKFHGTGYEFNRNTDYDANDYFNKFNGANNPRTVLNYNIYGFNIGGPVFIPKTYNTNKQKAFFFWNEEWRNIKQGSSVNTQNTLPTADLATAGSDLTYVAPAFANTDPTKGPVAGIIVPETSMVADPAYQAKLTSLGLTPGKPFPNNTIPHGLFDANMLAYLHAGVLPAPQTATGQSVESVPAPIKIRDDVVRGDYKFNDKWQLLVHYIHETDIDDNSHTFLGWDSSSYNTITSSEVSPANSAAIKLSGTLSPDLLMEASLNYDGNQIDIDNSKNSAAPSGWNVNPFFNNGRTTEIVNMSPFGAPYGTSEQMGSAPWHNAAQDFEPKIDISYTTGKHALKFGFSYNRYTKNQQLFGDANGQYSLGGNASSFQYTGNQDDAACTPPAGGWSSTNPAPAGCVIGDGIMDGLIGLAGGYQQQNGQPIRHYVNMTPSVYAMDNWHVTPRLSLQLGIRWDALPQAWERQNLISNFNPAHYSSVAAAFWNSDGSMNSTGPGFQTVYANYPASPGAPTTQAYLNGIDLAGRGGIPKQLVTNMYNTIQPRIGFTEDLFGNGKTVLRGGFGTFFERLQGNLIYNSATDSPFAFTPNANQVYFSNPHTSIQTGATAATPFFDSSEYNMATSFPDPAVAMFSFGVQHELAPAVIAVVQYVGNVAWHQEQYVDMNNFPLTTDPAVRSKGGNLASYTSQGGQLVTLPKAGQGNTANNAESFRTYQGFGQITSMTNNTNGSYNGFQAGLRMQNRWGLSGELDYTWSHEIDIQSGDNSCCTSNPWNIKYDKGSGSYDRRHMLNANYIYKLPFFNKAQGLTRSIAGGWEVAGTAIWETGTPTGLSFTSGGDPIGLGGGYTNRPNVSAKMTYPKKVKGWFDTTKVSLPTASWLGGPNQGFGNSGKDAIVGPGRVDFSTSLYKSFAMTERAHFELRFESFNTFNHAQFNGVNTQLNGGNYGWVNSDWGPRTLELGGKVVF